MAKVLIANNKIPYKNFPSAFWENELSLLHSFLLQFLKKYFRWEKSLLFILNGKIKEFFSHFVLLLWVSEGERGKDGKGEGNEKKIKIEPSSNNKRGGRESEWESDLQQDENNLFMKFLRTFSTVLFNWSY